MENESSCSLPSQKFAQQRMDDLGLLDVLQVAGRVDGVKFGIYFQKVETKRSTSGIPP